MAKYVGKGGTIDFGGNGVGNLNGWSLEVTAAPIEQKSLGDEFQEYSSTTTDSPKEWSGSASCWFDEADTAQAAMDIGVQLTLSLNVRGETTGLPTRTGNIIITGVSESAETDGMIETEFTFLGNGAITLGTHA